MTTLDRNHDRLFLIHLTARRDGRPSTFAVQCAFNDDGRDPCVLRVADDEHQLTPDEVKELVEKRGLHKALIASEWERRKPPELKGDHEVYRGSDR